MGLKNVRLPGLEQHQILPGSLERRESFVVIDLDRWERVIVKSENVTAANELRRFDRVLDAHGEIISNAKRGKGESGRFANQLHVHRQGGVARVIEIALGAFHHEAARIAAVGSIRKAAGMDRVHKLHPRKIQHYTAAMIQWMGFLYSLFAEPGRHL